MCVYSSLYMCLYKFYLVLKNTGQYCLLELFVIVEMFCIYTVQYGSHQPDVPVENLKCDYCDWEIKILIKGK